MEQHKAGGGGLHCGVLDLPKSEDQTPTTGKVVTTVRRP